MNCFVPCRVFEFGKKRKICLNLKIREGGSDSELIVPALLGEFHFGKIIFPNWNHKGEDILLSDSHTSDSWCMFPISVSGCFRCATYLFIYLFIEGPVNCTGSPQGFSLNKINTKQNMHILQT